MTNVTIHTRIVVFSTLLFSVLNPIMAQEPLKINAGNDLNICYGSFAELNATVEGGVPPYTYRWTPNEEISASELATISVEPTLSRTYKVQVTDIKGNSASDNVKVTVVQRPYINTIKELSIVLGEKINLDVDVQGNSGALTYTWRPTQGLDNPTTKSPTAHPSKTTTYTVIVKDSKGCAESAQITLNVDAVAKP